MNCIHSLNWTFYSGVFCEICKITILKCHLARSALGISYRWQLFVCEQYNTGHCICEETVDTQCVHCEFEECLGFYISIFFWKKFSTKIHASPTENLMLIVYANGSVWQNYRMRVKGPCEIDLRRFPFDTQSCRLMIESYSYHSGVGNEE